MKKILTLSAALMLCASFAMAQGGVGLYVGLDCAGGTPVTNTCTTNGGSAFSAFGTCVLPNGLVKHNFVGEISIVDVQTTLATIPDWWRADACRSTAFSLRTDGSITGATCFTTLWDAAVPAGNNIAGSVTNGGNRERLNLGAVLLPTAVYDLNGDGVTEEAVFILGVSKAKSVGTGACTGCLQGACIVLNEIQIQGQSDASNADYVHLTTPLAGRNFITYNSGAPTCAASTPTQNRTWGSIKALYR